MKHPDVNPCAFCLAKNTLPCATCAERYEMVLLEEDVTEEFLIERDMADTGFSGITPTSH